MPQRVSAFFASCGASQFEGNGFSSPEAAITAYAEAFRNGDVDEMIATFAIESKENGIMFPLLVLWESHTGWMFIRAAL